MSGNYSRAKSLKKSRRVCHLDLCVVQDMTPSHALHHGAHQVDALHQVGQDICLFCESHTITEQRSLPPSVAGDAFLSTCQELSVPRGSPQDMLDANSNNFHMRKLGDLPSQVLASTEVSRSEGCLSHSLLNSNLTSSISLSSEVEFKSGGFMPLRGRCPCLHGDDVTAAYSASVLVHPLPATSHVGQEGQGALSQSPCGTQSPPAKIPVLQDPQSSDSKEQLS